jgi:thiol-disulfide isomerase/thioredoxin
MSRKLLFLLFASLVAASSHAQGYKISLRTPQIKSGIAYLTYYMGNNLNIADSAAVPNTGLTVFSGKEKLDPGIYVLVLPGKQLRVEFLLDKQQQLDITVSDTADMVDKTTLSGSPENIPYLQYQKFVSVKGKLLQAERTAYMRSTTHADSALHEQKYNAYTKELNSYRENIIKTQPKSMLASLLNAMKDPPVPQGIPVTHQDSINDYNFYKSRYWDGISFMDDRIIRTPFFLKKLERYYREVMPRHPDSIIVDADYRLLLARSSPGMFKFLLNWLTDEYMTPKYMGQDAVFVHLFDKYHSKGVSNWLNEKQMETVSRRAYMLMANLIGEKAANLELIDSTGKTTPLYGVAADYTVVVFWDPNCGHCKEEMPKLDSIYEASWKKHKVGMYAVLTPDDKANNRTEWVNYIKNNHLSAWTHVYQTKEMEAADTKAQRPGFRQLYDVTMTPTLYLLDKEKHIIGKKLTWQQLNELMEVKWKTNPSN